MSKLADLAKRLESLGTIPAEAMQAGIEYADAQIKRAGKPGKSLHEGNAVVAKAEQSGFSMLIRRVHSTKGGFAYGIRADFLAKWVANEIERRIAERMKR